MGHTLEQTVMLLLLVLAIGFDDMTTYAQLAECIRSGQCSAAQIAEHMHDQVFARWYAQHYG